MTHRNKVLLAPAMIVALLAGAPFVAPALAQDGQATARATHFSGTCDRLLVAGRNYLDFCRGPMTISRTPDGRTSFAFSTDDGLVVTFSGALEVRRLLRVDRIAVATAGDPTAIIEEAEGGCESAWAEFGPWRHTCAGQTRSGRFVAAFTEDFRSAVVEVN